MNEKQRSDVKHNLKKLNPNIASKRIRQNVTRNGYSDMQQSSSQKVVRYSIQQD